MEAPSAKRPSLRDIQKGMTLGLLKDAARKVFYRKNYEDVSMDDIASEAGISRGTIYLHFSSKLELLFDVLKDDLADQMQVYDELSTKEHRTIRDFRTWLQHFRDQLERRHPSLFLFPIAFRNLPERKVVVVEHREAVIEKLGKRYRGFDLSGLSGEARKRKYAEAYIMLFQVEQVAMNFSTDPGTPDIEIGFDIVARNLRAFCSGA